MVRFFTVKSRAIQALLLFCICLFSTNTYATHYAAGDLRVRYIGKTPDNCVSMPDLTYEITLTLYGACEPSSASIGSGAGGNFRYGSANAGMAQTAFPLRCWDHITNLPPTGAYNGKIVNSLCPTFQPQNSCVTVANWEDFPGFREWTFRDTLTLPSQQTDWRFTYSNGDRNDKIKNLSFALGRSFYFEAGINNVAKYNTSTPVFEEFPLPYICAKVPVDYLNRPKDTDRDTKGQYLLTKSQVPLLGPVGGPGSPYPYQTGLGFIPSNPVNSDSGYVVNPSSGSARFVVPEKGRYVLAFLCEKWARNDESDLFDDVRLSYTMRDVQISVVNCTRPTPIINKVPLNLANATWRSITDRDSAIYVCPGSAMSFDMYAYNDDPAKANLVYWQSNSDTECPGSVFTKISDGQDTIRASFTWTPTDADLGDKNLVIVAKDSTCDADLPIVLPAPFSTVVRVIKGLDAGPDLPTCQFNAKGYQVLVKGTAYKLKVNWSNLTGGPSTDSATISDRTSISPVLKASGNTYFKVATTDLTGTCKVADTVQLVVDTANKIEIFPSSAVLCRPDYLQIEAKFTGLPPLTNHPCGVNMLKRTDVILDSAEIYGSFSFKENITFDTVGPGAQTFPNTVRTSKQQFLYKKDELRRYGFVASTITRISFNVAPTVNKADQEYSNFSISFKCVDDNFQMKKTNGFDQNMQLVYSNPGTLTFPPGWKDFELNDGGYNYDTTGNLLVEICYYNNADTEVCNGSILTYTPTPYISSLSYIPMRTDPFSTSQRIPDPDVIDVCPTTTNGDIVDNYTRPLIKLMYYEVPPAPVKYDWITSNFLSDSTIQQPLAYVPRSYSYIIQSEGRNNCKLYDTLNVYVPVHDYKLMPADTTICFGEHAAMEVNDGFDFKWYEYINGQYIPAKSVNCFDCKYVILKPDVTTTYKVVVYDSVWCIDTLTTTVTVLPLPEVKILTRDTIVKYGQRLQLLASGARRYNWLQPATVNNPNISYPLVTPTESMAYVVGGIGSNGCRAYDTVQVDVDMRENVLVPTAFSPNGDGKNDIFRVSNLTFQRIIDFRVFNRWGQEVYRTNETKAGWDGTWHGEPQDMGSYVYQITLGYPDGFTENYKGEVTLIR